MELLKFRTGDFESLKLNDSIAGRQEWWAKMMRHFEEADLFILRFNIDFGNDKVGGGYHWERGCNYIEMPVFHGEPYTYDENGIKFPSDEAFACFVHECQHFMHLYVDDGRCQAPGYEDTYEEDYPCRPDNFRMTPDIMRKCEYEASYRAVFYGKVFKMFPGSRVNFEVQMGNMFTRDIHLSDFWHKALQERLEKDHIDPNSDEFGTWVKEHIISKVKSISSWSNPKHDFPGILED